MSALLFYYKSIYSNYQFKINLDLQIPERATTQEIRRKSMTPQMLNMLRMRTPSIQPNLSPTGSWISLASGLASCCFKKRKRIHLKVYIFSTLYNIFSSFTFGLLVIGSCSSSNVGREWDRRLKKLR
jgi:hypothetical protein